VFDADQSQITFSSACHPM